MRSLPVELTHTTCSLFAFPFTTPDSIILYSTGSAPSPVVSRTAQLPRLTPVGNPLLPTKSLKLLTIDYVGFSETPWNFLNPVTWIVTLLGPSNPISSLRTCMKFPILNEYNFQ